jgi:hypothetical protein
MLIRSSDHFPVSAQPKLADKTSTQTEEVLRRRPSRQAGPSRSQTQSESDPSVPPVPAATAAPSQSRDISTPRQGFVEYAEASSSPVPVPPHARRLLVSPVSVSDDDVATYFNKLVSSVTKFNGSVINL